MFFVLTKQLVAAMPARRFPQGRPRCWLLKPTQMLCPAQLSQCDSEACFPRLNPIATFNEGVGRGLQSSRVVCLLRGRKQLSSGSGNPGERAVLLLGQKLSDRHGVTQ